MLSKSNMNKTREKNMLVYSFEMSEKENKIIRCRKLTGELLPLVEVGASWEVSAFVSHIYLPSSSGSPYPDIFYLI